MEDYTLADLLILLALHAEAQAQDEAVAQQVWQAVEAAMPRPP